MEEAQGLPKDELDLLNGRVNAAGGAKVVAVDARLSGPHLYRVLNGDRPLTAKTLYKLRSPLKLTQAEYDWLLMSARPGGRNVREALIQRVDSGDARDPGPADPADRAPEGPSAAAAPSAGHAGYLSLLDELRELHLRKGADYGSAADPFENIRAAVNLGVGPHVASLVRAQDKWVRILRFIERGALENESFEDSLMDMAAYLLITVALLREQLGGEADGPPLTGGTRG